MLGRERAGGLFTSAFEVRRSMFDVRLNELKANAEHRTSNFEGRRIESDPSP
jgi:hypothetical protein